ETTWQTPSVDGTGFEGSEYRQDARHEVLAARAGEQEHAIAGRAELVLEALLQRLARAVIAHAQAGFGNGEISGKSPRQSSCQRPPERGRCLEPAEPRIPDKRSLCAYAVII